MEEQFEMVFCAPTTLKKHGALYTHSAHWAAPALVQISQVHSCCQTIWEPIAGAKLETAPSKSFQTGFNPICNTPEKRKHWNQRTAGNSKASHRLQGWLCFTRPFLPHEWWQLQSHNGHFSLTETQTSPPKPRPLSRGFPKQAPS